MSTGVIDSQNRQQLLLKKRKEALEQLDNASFNWFHLKACLVSGIGFFTVIEFLGEWNDAINNDIMHLKRNVLDVMVGEGINKFILIGENVLNFHGSDDSYYEEWFDDVEDGWIAAVSFPDFVRDEMMKYKLDMYVNMGGTLEIPQWRTLRPEVFYELVSRLIQRRLN